MTDDFLSQLQERSAQSKAEWEQIDGLINILKGRDLSEDNKMLFQLIVLLSKQVRPMGSESDLEEITQDIGSMLTGLVDQLKKGKK